MENINSNIYSNKSVSTIGDECSQVGKEMSTFSKRKALRIKLREHIVSTSGNRGLIRVERSFHLYLKIQDGQNLPMKMMNS